VRALEAGVSVMYCSCISYSGLDNVTVVKLTLCTSSRTVNLPILCQNQDKSPIRF